MDAPPSAATGAMLEREAGTSARSAVAGVAPGHADAVARLVARANYHSQLARQHAHEANKARTAAEAARAGVAGMRR